MIDMISIIQIIYSMALPNPANNKPWAYICSKGYLAGLFMGELIFRGGSFVFQNGFGLKTRRA